VTKTMGEEAEKGCAAGAPKLSAYALTGRSWRKNEAAPSLLRRNSATMHRSKARSKLGMRMERAVIFQPVEPREKLRKGEHSIERMKRPSSKREDRWHV